MSAVASVRPEERSPGRYRPGFRIRIPSSSRSRSAAPHSSHSTAKVEEKGAEQPGQRRRIVPPHAHVAGT